MTHSLKNSLLSFLGILLVSFIQGNAQETSGGKSMAEIQYKTMSETQRQALFEKASTDTKDFSDDEIRELLYEVCLAMDGMYEEWHIAFKKLIDLGESIYPLLSEEALKPHEKEGWGKELGGNIAARIVGFFDRSEAGDMTEIRRTTLKVLEKFPKSYYTPCRVMGNIGEPEDVPKMLSFANEDDGIAFLSIMEAVGKIAAVSQIPEIEKAIADWEKTRNNGWRKTYQAEMKKHLANIRKRNVQWTPPSEGHEVTENNE